jgi:hypothetical protein
MILQEAEDTSQEQTYMETKSHLKRPIGSAEVVISQALTTVEIYPA